MPRFESSPWCSEGFDVVIGGILRRLVPQVKARLRTLVPPSGNPSNLGLLDLRKGASLRMEQSVHAGVLQFGWTPRLGKTCGNTIGRDKRWDAFRQIAKR